MIDWIKLALAALQIVRALVRAAERRGLIDQGRREQLADSLAVVAAAGGSARETRRAVDALTHDEITDELIK